MLRDTQTGGRQGRSTAMAGHMVNTFLCTLREEKMCGFILFIDLRAAFHRVIRQMTLVTTGYDPHRLDIEYILEHSSMPDALRPLAKLAWQNPIIMQHLEHEPHLAQQLIESNRLTHFGMPHTNSVAVSRRSSRPSNSLADSLFNITFTRPLDMARDMLVNAQLCYIIPPARADRPRLTKGRVPQQILSDVSFVDDALFAVQA